MISFRTCQDTVTNGQFLTREQIQDEVEEILGMINWVGSL